jgi:hypothetical protein
LRVWADFFILKSDFPDKLILKGDEFMKKDELDDVKLCGSNTTPPKSEPTPPTQPLPKDPTKSGTNIKY